MAATYHINKDGPMPAQRRKQRTLLDMIDLDSHQPREQALMNAFVASFQPIRFQQLFIRWVSCENIPFHKLESPYFRDLMAYTNGAIVDSGSLQIHSTIREWIVRSFDRHKGVVTEFLSRLHSRINVSFDSWSSRKFTSLLGLTVHFLDDEDKFRTFLLGLSRIEGRHSGENLADRVSEIIHEYGFESRVGYFVTDNAESNDTCLGHLSSEMEFGKQHRRLRCRGHIINLVARSILFGTDVDAFEEDCQAEKEIQDDLKLWRCKGPIGKLHNIVHWVQRSGQRIEKLHKLQTIENIALNLEDQMTYDVVVDNATRWNSSEAMLDRGYQLRNALNSLVQAEVTVERVCVYAEWMATTDPGDCVVDDPIQYWLLRKRQYPRLSRMAVDLFSVQAIFSEPERIFSLAGQMVTAQRGRLKADLIGAAQCISSWGKSGVIQIAK